MQGEEGKEDYRRGSIEIRHTQLSGSETDTENDMRDIVEERVLACRCIGKATGRPFRKNASSAGFPEINNI